MKQPLCGPYFTDTRNDGQRQNFPTLIGGDVALRQRGSERELLSSISCRYLFELLSLILRSFKSAVSFCK